LLKIINLLAAKVEKDLEKKLSEEEKANIKKFASAQETINKEQTREFKITNACLGRI
jgi:hypothetical protein